MEREVLVELEVLKSGDFLWPFSLELEGRKSDAKAKILLYLFEIRGPRPECTKPSHSHSLANLSQTSIRKAFPQRGRNFRNVIRKTIRIR